MIKATSRHRWRVTLGGLMGAVALLAVLFTWLHPISRDEAIRIASRRLRQNAHPGASEWAGYRTRVSLSSGGDGRDYWIVNFINPVNNEPCAQVSVDLRGNPVSEILAPPGQPPP